jgi:hypothetical protein
VQPACFTCRHSHILFRINCLPDVTLPCSLQLGMRAALQQQQQAQLQRSWHCRGICSALVQLTCCAFAAIDVLDSVLYPVQPACSTCSHSHMLFGMHCLAGVTGVTLPCYCTLACVLPYSSFSRPSCSKYGTVKAADFCLEDVGSFTPICHYSHTNHTYTS